MTESKDDNIEYEGKFYLPDYFKVGLQVANNKSGDIHIITFHDETNIEVLDLEYGERYLYTHKTFFETFSLLTVTDPYWETLRKNRYIKDNSTGIIYYRLDLELDRDPRNDISIETDEIVLEDVVTGLTLIVKHRELMDVERFTFFKDLTKIPRRPHRITYPEIIVIPANDVDPQALQNEFDEKKDQIIGDKDSERERNAS